MPQPAIAQSKVCNVCLTDKDLAEFPKDGRKTCKDCRNSYIRTYRRNTPELQKLQKIKQLYGLEASEYQLLVESNPHCPICGSEEPLVVDHDHSTQEVRGLICNHCNLVLGHARDNIEILKNAIAYLNNEPLSEATSAEAQMDTSTDN